MFGEDFLEVCCSMTATLVLNILEQWVFHPKEKTQQGMLLEENLTESKKTLNARQSAEESKAGSSANFPSKLLSNSDCWCNKVMM